MTDKKPETLKDRLSVVANGILDAMDILIHKKGAVTKEEGNMIGELLTGSMMEIMEIDKLIGGDG